MNSLSDLKKKLAPRSRWGAISLAPRREYGGLTWSEAENRPQPQDGSAFDLMDEPEVALIPHIVPSAKPAVLPSKMEPSASKPFLALVS